MKNIVLGFSARLNWVLGLVISFAPAAYLLSTGLFHSYLALASPTWLATPSVTFFVIDYPDRREVTYSYAVNGALRSSDRISFSYPFPEDAPLLREYADGQTVTVYYSPLFPAQATLQTGWRWGPLVFIGLGVLMAGLGYVAFLWGVGRLPTNSIDPVNWT